MTINPFQSLNRKIASLTSLASICTATFVAGCGTDLNSNSNSLQTSGDAEVAPLADHTRRFTQSQINQVYTEAVSGGRPVLRPNLVSVYRSPAEAPDFAAEFGDFSNAGEFWGFMNLTSAPSAANRARFAVTFESISQWKQIRNTEGNPIFKDSYKTNANGRRVPDAIDGVISGGRETNTGRQSIKVSITSVNIDTATTMTTNGNNLTMKMVNTSDVNSPIGKIIKRNGFQIKLELYPYRGGYLVYGASLVKLEKFEDKVPVEEIPEQLNAIFAYLHGKVYGR